MSMKIRVSTRADQFRKRKQELLDAGYRIEDEQPIPINGLCSFTAIRVVAEEPEVVFTLPKPGGIS
jgi:hypothetical protein